MKALVIFFLTIFFPLNIQAQSNNVNSTETLSQNYLLEAVSDTIPELNIFENDIPLDITLKYDITSFIRHKLKGEYLDAELQIHYSDTKSITKNIRLKARGNFRRGQCFFPPIHLNFKTDPITNNELKGIKKVKLVTHCSTSKSNQEYILKEYLAYKLYNVLTPLSFRVRLLNITYIDTGKKQRNYQQYGFIIEPLELVAKRNEATIIEPSIVRQEHVIEEDADRAALFQYLIGNTDWRIKGGHNTKYIKSFNHLTSKIIPIPYDFDFSGFVGAHYSFPQSWTSIESVKDREYLGYCRNSDEAYLNNINNFIERKGEIIETVESFNYLEERRKKSLLSFIKSFYNLTNRPEYFIRTLKQQCRTNF